jgi:hypothetical protein
MKGEYEEDLGRKPSISIWLNEMGVQIPDIFLPPGFGDFRRAAVHGVDHHRSKVKFDAPYRH